MLRYVLPAAVCAGSFEGVQRTVVISALCVVVVAVAALSSAVVVALIVGVGAVAHLLVATVSVLRIHVVSGSINAIAFYLGYLDSVAGVVGGRRKGVESESEGCLCGYVYGESSALFPENAYAHAETRRVWYAGLSNLRHWVAASQ